MQVEHLVVLVCLVSGVAASAEVFVDPAPPVVNAAPAAAAPEAREQEGWKFHQAPRPLAAGAVTHEWRSLLGPTHNAVSTERPLRAEFGAEGPARVWEVVKGSGYAAPAIADGWVVLLHRVGDEEVVDCLEAETGRRYWRYAYPTAYKDRYGYNDGPRSSPVVDGERVYTFGSEGKLHCLALRTGQVIWKRDVLKEFGIGQNFFGVGSTPLVEGKTLIINIGAPRGPSVAGFDKTTGKLVWGAGKRWGASYASPVPAEVHGLRRVLVFAGGESRPPAGGLMCIDPADGAVDFEWPWRGRRYESVNASNPVVLGEQVFVSECYGRGSLMLKLKRNVEALAADATWENEEFGTHFMTAIAKDGYLYGVHGHGPLDAPIVCVEIKSGKEMWRHEPKWEETIETPSGPVTRRLRMARCSLLLAEGRFLCLGEYGHLAWLDLTPKGYREICRAWLFAANETWTGPVISRGLLYVCQNGRGMRGEPTRLLCYDLRGK